MMCIERVCFPFPKDTDYLSKASLDAFLNKTDLSTSETRMKELLYNAPFFEAEMSQSYELCRKSPFYDFLTRNIIKIKVWLFKLLHEANFTCYLLLCVSGQCMALWCFSTWISLWLLMHPANKKDIRVSIMLWLVILLRGNTFFFFFTIQKLISLFPYLKNKDSMKA
jgi:hypothetical protein